MAEYRYNGLNFRISFKYDNDQNGGGGPDGTVDSYDHTYYLAYNERWRNLGTRRDSDTYVNERLVYHAAGVGGAGGSSYIDDVILTDYQDRANWTSAAGSTLTKRMYLCQNWRHDVSAVVTDTGKLLERAKHSSYGVPFGLPAGDANSDGAYDSSDVLTGSYEVRKDTNQDGTIDSADKTWADSITGSYQTLGRGVLSSLSVANRKGYAGYELASELAGSKCHIRHRVYDAELGRWVSRDKDEYVDGANLYECVGNQPLLSADPFGLTMSCHDQYPKFEDCIRCCDQRIPGVPGECQALYDAAFDLCWYGHGPGNSRQYCKALALRDPAYQACMKRRDQHYRECTNSCGIAPGGPVARAHD